MRGQFADPNVWQEISRTAHRHCYDSYLAATLAQRNRRQDLIVLAAFSGEIQRIVRTVGEPVIAAIRLQWWREALDLARTSQTGHRMADALRDMIACNRLPTGLFIGHIDAQEFELQSRLAPTLDDLKVLFMKRDGGLFQLAVLLTCPDGPPINADVISRSAYVYGLARTLCEFSRRCLGRQLLLPADLTDAYGLTNSGNVDQMWRQGRQLINAVTDDLDAELISLRADWRGLPPCVRSALLPVGLAPLYLDVAKRQLNAAKPSDMIPTELARAWRLLLVFWSGRL
ncbi:MAG: squalene/phytoene synthase family protein [Hyphomicrobiaceae bacterium]